MSHGVIKQHAKSSTEKKKSTGTLHAISNLQVDCAKITATIIKTSAYVGLLEEPKRQVSCDGGRNSQVEVWKRITRASEGLERPPDLGYRPQVAAGLVEEWGPGPLGSRMSVPDET